MHKISGLFLIVALTFGSCKNNTEQSRSENPRDSLLDAINSAILANPENAENYFERAIYLSNSGNADAALGDLDRAIRANPMEGKYYGSKGDIYFGRQQFDNALAEFDTCSKYSPEFTECALKSAEIHLYFRRYAEALEQINNALRKDEYIPRAYFMKGILYAETGDTTLAASSYQTATEVNPNYYEAYIALGFLYAAAKNDLAIEYYSTAITLNPKSVEALYDKAIYLQDTGFRDSSRYEDAMLLYDKIIEIDPDNAAAYFNKGYIHLEYYSINGESNYAEASQWFTKAIERYPQYYQAFYNRGLSEESMGNKAQAEADYRQTLKIEPDYTPASRSLSRMLDN